MSIGSISTSLELNLPDAPLDNGAQGLVTTILNETGTLASEAFDRALASIESLGDYAVTVPPISVPDIPLQTVSALPIGTAPTEPTSDLAASFPAAPTEPTLGTLEDIDLGSEPVLDAVAPSLLTIELPDPLALNMPASPAINDISVPVEPSYTLPEVPTFLSLNIPDAPILDLPLFEDTLETAPSVPGVTFAYSESEYNTALLTLMNTRLVDLVGGESTGLDADVEAAIWNRARDRTAKLTERAVGEATRMVAGRGFSMPQGTLVRLVQQAVADGLNKDAEDNREVMIKQADLEQQNFRFAFQTAMQLEGSLIQHFDQVQARALDAAKFTQQAAIELTNAKINLFNAQVAAFRVKAEVFKVRLEAALAQLDIYKAQIEAEKAKATLNVQLAEIYKARIEGVKVVADVYRATVEAVRARIEAERNKVEVFKAQMDGFDSAVKAKTAEYQGYGERVKAELVKVQSYGEQVRAFGSRVQAYEALVNARLRAAELDFKQAQEFPVELYKARIQAHMGAVQAEAERLRAVVEVFKGRVQAFGEVERAKTAYTQAQVEAVKATTAVYTAQADVAVRSGEITLRAALSAAETAQASLRAAGQLSGQLAASAMAARNVSASLSSGISETQSRSFQRSTSRNVSDSDNYNVNINQQVD